MPGLTNNVVYVNRNLLGVDDNGNILQLGLPVGDGTLRLPEVVVKPSYIPTYNDIDNTIAMDPRIKLETPSIPTEKGMVSLTFLSPFVRMAFIDAPAAAANYTVNKFGLPAVAPYAPMPTDGEALFDLPAYGSVANVLKQGTKGAAKMFSNWATEREIKNTINLRIKSWDTTLPNHTISLGNGRLQFRTPTYQVYTGPKHSISEIINPDGSVNIKNILKVLNDALENIPGGTIARHRLENKDFHITDWNTFLHSRDAYQRAMAAQYPEEARFPVLMHDFGKMWAGDGHGPYGASILEQMFPDATKELIAAIAEHMDSMPQSAMGKLVKGADISENNQFRNAVKDYIVLKSKLLQLGDTSVTGNGITLKLETTEPFTVYSGDKSEIALKLAMQRPGSRGDYIFTLINEVPSLLESNIPFEEFNNDNYYKNFSGGIPYDKVPNLKETIAYYDALPETPLSKQFANNPSYRDNFISFWNNLGVNRLSSKANKFKIIKNSTIGKILADLYKLLSESSSGLLKDRVLWRNWGDSDPLRFFDWQGHLGEATHNSGFIGPGNYFSLGEYATHEGGRSVPYMIKGILKGFFTRGGDYFHSELGNFLKESPQTRVILGGLGMYGLIDGHKGDELVTQLNHNIKSLFPHPFNATGGRFLRDWSDPDVYKAIIPIIGGTTLINRNNNE